MKARLLDRFHNLSDHLEFFFSRHRKAFPHPSVQAVKSLVRIVGLTCLRSSAANDKLPLRALLRHANQNVMLRVGCVPVQSFLWSRTLVHLYTDPRVSCSKAHLPFRVDRDPKSVHRGVLFVCDHNRAGGDNRLRLISVTCPSLPPFRITQHRGRFEDSPRLSSRLLEIRVSKYFRDAKLRLQRETRRQRPVRCSKGARGTNST